MGKRRYFYFVIGIVLLAAFSITGISLLISSPALYVENIKISKEEAEFFVSESKKVHLMHILRGNTMRIPLCLLFGIRSLME